MTGSGTSSATSSSFARNSEVTAATAPLTAAEWVIFVSTADGSKAPAGSASTA
jgi:hypothetical protein